MTTPPLLTQMATNFAGGSTFGTTVAAGSPANTKGSYVQLIASTPFDVYGIWVLCFTSGLVDATNNRQLLDIATGPSGSEIVKIANLLSGSHSNSWHSPLGYFPIFIPAGTRISARSQAAVASRASQIAIWIFGTPADPSNPPAVATAIQTIGADTAASGGTAVTAGASGAEGSWTSLGTVSGDAKGAVFLVGTGGDTAIQSGGWTADFGRGPGGAQTVISSDFYLRSVASGDYSSPIQPTVQPMFGEDLPSGTELWARVSSPLASPDAADAIAYVFTGYAPIGGPAGVTVSAAYSIQALSGSTSNIVNRATGSSPAEFSGTLSTFYEVTDKPELHKTHKARLRKSRW